MCYTYITATKKARNRILKNFVSHPNQCAGVGSGPQKRLITDSFRFVPHRLGNRLDRCLLVLLLFLRCKL
jgi:hypothetical protein